MNNLIVDYSQCSKKCEGIVVISYDEYDINSFMNSYLSKLSNTEIFDTKFFPKFQPNLKWSQKMSDLSDQYSKYKEVFNFPTKLKGKIHIFENDLISTLLLELKFTSPLHYVKIYFKTSMYQRITKDTAVKFEGMLSTIGGTMGLLLGFSIISGVEIVYFAFRFATIYCKKFCTRMNAH